METDISDDGYQRSIVADMLLPGENVVCVAAISRGIYWKSFAVLLVSFALTLRYGVWLGPYGLVIGGLMLLLAHWTKKYLVLAATDHRIIIRSGVINQEVLQLRYPQIETVDTVYPPVGLVLGYGSVVITGTGQSCWIIPFVQDAEAFRDGLTQKLFEREESLQQGATITPTTPQPAAPPP